ncbi:MAG: transposase [bacterium]
MTQYRRLLIPGATYFFTVRLEQRGATLLTDHIQSLRYAYAKTIQDYPVTCHAMVVLPDHIHAIWTEPEGGIWYSERWRRIKARFTQAIAPLAIACTPQDARRKHGLWQRRFCEHAIRNEEDFRRAVDHCRTNPVRHGLVSDPDLWPYSSFTKGRQQLPADHKVPLAHRLSPGQPPVRHATT